MNYDSDRFAYDTDEVDASERERAQHALWCEQNARAEFVQTMRAAATRYAADVRDADLSLISRFCRATRRNTAELDEAIEDFVELVEREVVACIDAELLDADTMRDLRERAEEM